MRKIEIMKEKYKKVG